MYVLWSMYVTTYLVSLGDARVTQNEKNYVFQKKVQYIPVHNMNTNGWGILLSSISRTILTRITSFPENSLCHGLKCVTEGRHKYYINIYISTSLRCEWVMKKKCRLRRTNLYCIHTRRLLSLRTPKSAVICIRQGEVKVCLSKSRCRSKSLSH